MKTIASTIIGLSLAVAGFAQTPVPAAKTDATAAAPAKAKKVKKHKKAAGVMAEKPAASSTPATK